MIPDSGFQVARLHLCHMRCTQALLAVPGIAELLDGLAAYTQNHFARLGRLQRSAYLLDYTLASMNVLRPPAADGASADGNIAGFGLGHVGGFAISEVTGEDGHGEDGVGSAIVDVPPSPATPPQQEAAAVEVAAGSGAAAHITASDRHAGPSAGVVKNGNMAAGSHQREAADVGGAATPKAKAAQAVEPEPSSVKPKKSSGKKQKKRKAGELLAAVTPAAAGARTTARARSSKRTGVSAS